MTIGIRRAGQRFVTREGGRETFHSFSFGRHYDPSNVGFAAMVAHNDEHLPPGTGYDDHPHRDVEIVTWVLTGALHHTDADGHDLVLGPGRVLRTSAGSGIVHAERTMPGITTRFVQTWLRPDESGGTASLVSAEAPAGAALTEVVGPAGAVGIGTTGARLYLAAGIDGEVLLPDVPVMHLFVAEGEVQVGERTLMSGDAAALREEGGRALRSAATATVAVWTFA